MKVNLLKKVRKYPKLYKIFLYLFNICFFKIKSKGDINHFKYNDTLMYKTKVVVYGNNNRVLVGKNTTLNNCKVIINGNGHTLKIGENCILENTTFTFTQNNGITVIGNNTTINGALVYSGEAKKVIIGNDCMLSSNIEIRTSDSHTIISLTDKMRINHAKDIVIGNHVWVGNGGKIWKGAKIGNNSVIGTGSIVTGEITGNSIAAGVPARVVKENISWNRELL